VTGLPIYFVTGASGFVGRHVCKLLIQTGFQVRALVRSSDADLIQAGVKVWIGDLWDEEILREAISGATVIIHCAGNARFGNGKHYYRENVELTEYLINAAKKHAGEISRFIYVSTIGAVDRLKHDKCIIPLDENTSASPSSDYGRSKLMAEEVVSNSDLPFVIVRPTMVVGADMRFDSHFAVFARQSFSGALFAKLAWTGKLSVVHVDDLSNAILTVATHENAIGQIYFCAGEPVSIGEFFRLCNPDKAYICLSYLPVIFRPFINWIPFTLKVLLFPALTASDEKLRVLGWKHQFSAQSALKDVVEREKARVDPDASPGGQTVITGAASGLGRALAIYLSSKRDHVLLIDKNGAALEELANSLSNCEISIVDLADENDIDKLVTSSKWNAYNISEIYACAGIGLRGRIQDISIENHRKMFAINVIARIALAKVAIDSMRKHHFGRIVFISSSSAFQPLPFMATYAATNSALLSIGESWGAELANEMIQIMTVCPGGMQTNFQKSGGVKEIEGEKLMSPEDVVTQIIQGLRKQRQTLMVSFRSFAMSMLARSVPRSVLVKLWYRLMEKMR
jgi:short-subunit dehydrogenase